MRRPLITIQDYSALAEIIAPRGSWVTAVEGIYQATVTVRPPWWHGRRRSKREALIEELAREFNLRKPITTRVVIRVQYGLARHERIVT